MAPFDELTTQVGSKLLRPDFVKLLSFFDPDFFAEARRSKLDFAQRVGPLFKKLKRKHEAL